MADEKRRRSQAEMDESRARVATELRRLAPHGKEERQAWIEKMLIHDPQMAYAVGPSLGLEVEEVADVVIRTIERANAKTARWWILLVAEVAGAKGTLAFLDALTESGNVAAVAKCKPWLGSAGAFQTEVGRGLLFAWRARRKRR